MFIPIAKYSITSDKNCPLAQPKVPPPPPTRSKRKAPLPPSSVSRPLIDSRQTDCMKQKSSKFILDVCIIVSQENLF